MESLLLLAAMTIAIAVVSQVFAMSLQQYQQQRSSLSREVQLCALASPPYLCSASLDPLWGRELVLLLELVQYPRVQALRRSLGGNSFALRLH